MRACVFILQLFQVSSLISGIERRDDDELRLLNDLFVTRKYNKQVLPTERKEKTIRIKFGIAYVQLVELNDKEQMMISNIWVRQVWTNTHLRWDPKKYGGISSINVDPSKVWLPDIVLYNNAKKGHDSLTMYTFKTKVILESNGENKWFAPTIIRSGCSINITYFPFDDQVCNLQFGSWTYTESKIDIQPRTKEVDMKNYLPSSQFKLISAKAERDFTKSGGQVYPYINFVFRFRRQPGFFLFNVIIPSLVITCFAILTFSSPHITGERVGLAIESFLSLSFLCLMVAGSIPINSDVTPLITKFLLMCMAMISMAVLFNLVSMNLLQSQAIPPLVRFIFFHVLGPMVGVCEGRNKGLQKRRKSILIKEQGTRVLSYLDRTSAAELGNDAMSAASLLQQTANQTPNKQPSMPYKRFMKKTKPAPPSDDAYDIVSRNMDDIIKQSHIEVITQANKDFWRCLAQTLDRIFLISFFLSFIFVSAVMLLKGFGHHIK